MVEFLIKGRVVVLIELGEGGGRAGDTFFTFSRLSIFVVSSLFSFRGF